MKGKLGSEATEYIPCPNVSIPWTFGDVQGRKAFLKNHTSHVENFSTDQLAWVAQSSAALSPCPFLPAEACPSGA